jgi:catechol 2,3-dioxygenase-like lactoylglutathione lyase family enzyme
VVDVASRVLFAADPDKTADFYRALGIDLEHEVHGEGPVHYAAELGQLHFAIYPAESSATAPDHRTGGSSFPGFYVESLDETTRALVNIGSPVLSRHETMPWGCRIVAADPDGRPVEINQQGHCDSAV